VKNDSKAGRPPRVVQAVNEYEALCKVAKAAQIICHEMGSRISAAAFDEFSGKARDNFKNSLVALDTLRKGLK
jgi:hypothetical protein